MERMLRSEERAKVKLTPPDLFHPNTSRTKTTTRPIFKGVKHNSQEPHKEMIYHPARITFFNTPEFLTGSYLLTKLSRVLHKFNISREIHKSSPESCKSRLNTKNCFDEENSAQQCIGVVPLEANKINLNLE
jgi:hypothetical protein